MAGYEKQQPQMAQPAPPPLNAGYYGPAIPPPQPAYYGPPPPAPRRSAAGCLIKVAVAIAIALGAAVLVLWLIYRPSNLQAYADSAALTRFDLGSSNNGAGGDLLQYNLTVNLRLRNRNRFDIRYDYAEARASYDGERFGFAPLQPFILERKNEERITATFSGSAVMTDDDVPRTHQRETREGFYYVKVRVYSDLSYRVRIIRRSRSKSKITCVLRLPVPTGGNAATTFLGTKCDVDF